VNQKDPGFDRFSPRAFEWRFVLFSESLWLSKCAKLANLIRNPPEWLLWLLRRALRPRSLPRERIRSRVYQLESPDGAARSFSGKQSARDASHPNPALKVSVLPNSALITTAQERGRSSGLRPKPAQRRQRISEDMTTLQISSDIKCRPHPSRILLVSCICH
jgi:hypothetical protein